MFVEETRLTDGTAHAEVTRIDSNGLYEEDRAGERAAVEHALVQGYLQHVAHAGFASVSFPTGSNPALCNSHLAFYTLQPEPTPCTSNPTPCNRFRVVSGRFELCTLQPAAQALHPTP